MTSTPFPNRRLSDRLLQADYELAQETRRQGCPHCGGELHSARYPRRPRGVADELADDWSFRFSFCCSRDECRRRTTPPSVRFLGPKQFLGALVALLTAMRQGPTPVGARKLRQLFGVSRSTLDRWRRWWEEEVPRSRFWREARAWFPIALDESQLAIELAARFHVGNRPDGLRNLLRFLCPLSHRQETENHDSRWASRTRRE